MIKVRAHTCYLGTTGFAAHARSFFREFSKHVDLRVRNYTWDSNPEYLNEVDFSIIDTITLGTPNGEEDFPITHSFPNLPWVNKSEGFEADVDIVLMDMHHKYFYQEYNSPTKIAFTVWESTELEEGFFNQLLKFDFVWVVTEWHRKMIIKQGYPSHRVFVVNEGVNDEFRHDEITKEIPELEDGRFKFVFFGRWDYRKSVPEILKTFLTTFDSSEPVDLILSADNPYSIDGMNSTEERLSHYGLNDERIKVKHFVSREDYVTYIKRGNVFLSCARSEGWNIPLIEAMSSGTPSIYSNWGAQLEFAESKGIPVSIEKELPASIGADLGFAGHTPGLYAEPNFEDLGRKMRDVFEKYETYQWIAQSDKEEIRTRFSWENVANRAYLELLNVSEYEITHPIKKDATVVMSHADSDEKEELLRLSILSLKRQGYPVIVSSHIPVSKRIHDIADYVVFDKENPIVFSEEYASLSNTVPVHYIKYNEFGLSYSFDFNHGYAALKLIKNGLSIASVNQYERVHFVNYDYIIKDPSVLENHSIKLNDSDIFSYNWNPGEDSLNSGFFSGKTDLILKSLEKFNSKQDYFSFPGIVILEDFLHKAFTESGLTISLGSIKDIEDKNCLNSYVLPTYPLIKTKSKNPSYLYLTKENQTGEYILCALGSHEEPLKFVIEYAGKQSEFIADPRQKPMVLLSIPNSMLEEGFSVNLPDYDERRKYDLTTKIASSNLNSRDWMEEIGFETPKKKINIDFNNGPKVEILGSGIRYFQVEFINNENGKILYTSNIGMNCWTSCSIKYYVDWLIRVKDLMTGEVEEYKMDLKGKKVKISMESSSLGDSIAWFAHIEEFQKKHECKVYVSTFKNELFESNYPNLRFIKPGQRIDGVYVTYLIGWFYDGVEFNSHLNPRDFKTIPMQATTTDILGLEHTSLRPRIVKPVLIPPIKGPYVCIGMHSTAQSKYWNNPTGWQEVTDYFLSRGYKVVMLSLEEDGYMGNRYPKGVTKITGERSLNNTINYLQHAEMFIGIGSGLSWLSWAINIPTVIISGFSTPMTEAMDENVIRIFKGGVCNGCFNRHRLDAGDWNWCPDHKGTARQFECSRHITGKEVINAIDEFYSNGRVSKKTVDVIVQESYDLGMVQNHKEIFEAAEHFKSQGVKNFMEIGTDQGGSFAIWSKLSEDGIRISVDLPHGPYGRPDYNEYERDEYLRSLGSNVTTIWGSSHDESIKERVSNILKGEKLDFLFIDGDHTYEGVKQDYEMYKEFVKQGGWIGFHDIKDTEFHRNANCRVDQLWNELEGNKVEFLENMSAYGGIGFVQNL
jgi:autotransporter strand-loop-strand O-heptosyltransferase